MTEIKKPDPWDVANLEDIDLDDGSAVVKTRAFRTRRPTQYQCSFCRHTETEVAKLLVLEMGKSSPAICIDCVSRAYEYLKELGSIEKNEPCDACKESTFAVSSEFLESQEWRMVRMQVLEHYGAKCMACGRTAQDGVTINVDHIKPRRSHPALALVFDNLQVLCNECNHGKGNWSHKDWRPTPKADA